jgi:hypothetical protein
MSEVPLYLEHKNAPPFDTNKMPIPRTLLSGTQAACPEHLCCMLFAPVFPCHGSVPLGRSRYQTSEFPITSEFPAESPTHTYGSPTVWSGLVDPHPPSRSLSTDMTRTNEREKGCGSTSLQPFSRSIDSFLSLSLCVPLSVSPLRRGLLREGARVQYRGYSKLRTHTALGSCGISMPGSAGPS